MPVEKLLDIYSDGASRGNPGPSCYAFIFVMDGTITGEFAGYLGRMTNNAAEYHAIRYGLREAHAAGYRSVRVFTDSELVKRQITGEYRVINPVLAALWKEVRDVAGKFGRISFHHVLRSERHIQRADILCNLCLDAHRHKEK